MSMGKKVNDDCKQKFYKAILSLKTEDECKKFFNDMYNLPNTATDVDNMEQTIK